jgi:hypothetical protein
MNKGNNNNNSSINKLNKQLSIDNNINYIIKPQANNNNDSDLKINSKNQINKSNNRKKEDEKNNESEKSNNKMNNNNENGKNNEKNNKNQNNLSEESPSKRKNSGEGNDFSSNQNESYSNKEEDETTKNQEDVKRKGFTNLKKVFNEKINKNNMPKTRSQKEITTTGEKIKAKIMDRINRGRARSNENKKLNDTKSQNILMKAQLLETVLGKMKKPEDSNISNLKKTNIQTDSNLNQSPYENTAMVAKKNKKKRVVFKE